MGLEVYSQNFTANVPVSYSAQVNIAGIRFLSYNALLVHACTFAHLLQESTVVGHNVYGILRAGRSLGTESIILSVPLLREEKDGGHNRHGIAVMLALVEYFQSKKEIT